MAENTSNNVSDLSIREQVKNVIVEVLGVKPEQVTDEASFKDDLGADSLDQVELVMKLEEVFKEKINGEISEKDAEQLTTVGSVIKYIENDGKLA
ncbi:MAG: acyl carrier protein [Opitutales bacterium]|jgi:acyl carrier protein|nr:acyl carrier protein [Opitutales bacterium]